MTTALPDVMNLSGHGTPITVQDMIERGKFVDVNTAIERLRQTEPLAYVDFETGEGGVRFRVADTWNADLDHIDGLAAVDAYVRIGRGDSDGHEYQLTKDAIFEAANLTQSGLSKTFVAKSPGFLLADALNYWYRSGMSRGCRLMVVGSDQLGMAVAKESVQPFSNVALVEQAVAAIEARHPGVDIYVDGSKLAHSLRKTWLQLVIPELGRVINSGEENDIWWGGIQLANSQIAALQTNVSGYMFRQLCTNGMVDVGANGTSWSRRGGQEETEVYAWARQAVDDVLGGLEHSFEAVQALTNIPLDGELGATARDVFDQYRVPSRVRQGILDELVETNNLTMYGLVNAITAAANGDVRPEDQQFLMSVGGDVVHHTERCGSCRRILPEGLIPSED